jgi:hypothetical protein
MSLLNDALRKKTERATTDRRVAQSVTAETRRQERRRQTKKGTHRNRRRPGGGIGVMWYLALWVGIG